MIDRYENQMSADSAITPTTVLVVEDDLAAARSLRFLLEHYGYAVSMAACVRQAIKLLDEKPQIILLDLTLPDGDGTTVMETLKARKSNARVFVVTGVTEHDRLRKVQQLCPQLLLHKPLNFLNLLDQLRHPAA